MPFEIGQVFHLQCLHCNPPKMKMFVVALLDPFRCFLINSEPTALERSSPKKMAAMAFIRQGENPAFLTHDSYVDCNFVAVEHSAESITRAVDRSTNCFKGALSTPARAAVVAALTDNFTIPRKYRDAMLQAWNV